MAEAGGRRPLASVGGDGRFAGAGDEFCSGAVSILPAVIAAVPFGVLLGALAAAKGLSPLEVALMSSLVFAGGSQFAAVELWTHPAPVVLLAFSTLLINSRHMLMGASIARKMGAFRGWQTGLALFVLADEVWAVAEQRAANARLTPAFWLGLGAMLWPAWVASTVFGAVAGGVLGDPVRYGFDFAFTAIFIGLIAGLWKGRGSAVAVLCGGATAALVWRLAGPPWHIAAGACAGILASALAARPMHGERGEAP